MRYPRCLAGCNQQPHILEIVPVRDAIVFLSSKRCPVAVVTISTSTKRFTYDCVALHEDQFSESFFGECVFGQKIKCRQRLYQMEMGIHQFDGKRSAHVASAVHWR